MTTVPAAIAGFTRHIAEPGLTPAEEASLAHLYRLMECDHRLLVHVDEATAREQLAVNTLASFAPLSPETFARHIDALRRHLRAQLEAWSQYEDLQTVERLEETS